MPKPRKRPGPMGKLAAVEKGLVRAVLEEVVESSDTLSLDSASDRAVLYGRLIVALGVDE